MSTGTSKNAASGTRSLRHLALFLAACLLLVALAAAGALALLADGGTASQLRADIVALNDAAQAASTPEEAQAVAFAQQALRNAAATEEANALKAVLLVVLVAVACLVALAAYLYRAIALPFAKLQGFAEEVASGNLDAPLAYERANPFGKFAWAFDHMRSELKRARASELAAIEENKTVLASLAHDLRTPIASIRTYSEALILGLDSSEEERREYAQVIERRSVEVSQLVDDLLTHSLAELDRITVQCSPLPIVPLLRQVATEAEPLEAFIIEADEAIVHTDELRLRQVLENLLVNASKYAPASGVEVSGAMLDDATYRIVVRDFGPGMAPTDLPFAFNRFYRGANAEGVQGSGLGLFVVRHVIERMGGHVALENAHPGLAVTIDLPLEDNAAS